MMVSSPLLEPIAVPRPLIEPPEQDRPTNHSTAGAGAEPARHTWAGPPRREFAEMQRNDVVFSMQSRRPGSQTDGVQ
jgi:hypothetical protein